MNLSGAITTSNAETQKSLKSIDQTLKKILISQQKESKAAETRSRKAEQAAKRKQADGGRMGAIMGTSKGDDVKIKKSGGDILKKLLLAGGVAAAIGAGIKALFGDKNIISMLGDALFGEKGLFGAESRKKMWEGLFGVDGLFGKNNRDMLWEKLFNDQTGWFGKEARTRMWNSLFGEKGMFGKEGRERIWNGLFGPEGWFGASNMKKFENFMFGEDGIFGEKMRKNTYEFLLGKDGIFGSKNLNQAYEGMKSFFVDDADWKKEARKGIKSFFVDDAQWKKDIRSGFEMIMKDWINFSRDMVNGIGDWVRQLPGFKQAGDAMDAVGAGADWMAEGMRHHTSEIRKNLGWDPKSKKRQLREAKERKAQLEAQLESTKGSHGDHMLAETLTRKIKEQTTIINKLENTQKLQSGGPVRVPGTGTGDKVPMSLPSGSFVLNKNASNFLYRQKGGTVVPTMLEPEETVFPFATPDLLKLNKSVPRFGNANYDEGLVARQAIKRAKNEVSKPRRGDGSPSEQKLNANSFDDEIRRMAETHRKKGGKIFLHWTGGSYSGKPSGYYHNIVTGDGKRHQMQSYDQFSTPRGHTWKRNSTGIGISAASMFNGKYGGPWPTPPKPAQIEGMAKEIAKVAKMWSWKESDFTVKNVMTHAEAALLKDGYTGHPNYGPLSGDSQTKWDFHSMSANGPTNGGDVFRQKALSYFKGGGFTDAGTTGNTGTFVFPVPRSSIGTKAYQLFGAPRDGGAREHAGIDIVENRPWGADPRLPVRSVKDGVITSISSDPYAGSITVSHGDGYDTRYVHVNNFKGKKGDNVKAGQQIASLISLPQGGDGGNTHLHFELYKNGSNSAIDPTSYLKSAGMSFSGETASPADSMRAHPDGEQGEQSPSKPKSALESFLGPMAGVIMPMLKGSSELMSAFMGPIAGLGVGAASLLSGELVGQDKVDSLLTQGQTSMNDFLNDILGLGTNATPSQVKNVIKNNSTTGPSSAPPGMGTDPGWKNVYNIARGMGDPWPELTATQWALESGWGKKKSGKNNLFGIKARGGEPGSWHWTKEEENGVLVDRKEKFRDFETPEEGIKARVGKWRYKVQSAQTARSAVEQIQLPPGAPIPGTNEKSHGVYATDSNYVNKIIDIMQRQGVNVDAPRQKLQRGGMVSTLLEPGETVGTLDDWNNAIPRFGSSGSSMMSPAVSQLMKTFYEMSNNMSSSDTPVVIMNQQSPTPKATGLSADTATPMPALSGGPSMASLSDIINRVSWSNVF